MTINRTTPQRYRTAVAAKGEGEIVVIRRMGLAVVAAAVGVSALTGLTGPSVGTASAAPGCADYHWIGAAGSGQRDAANLTANGGMGGVVYQSYLELRDELAASGLTMDAEAVQYPAAPVPMEGGLGGWMNFMDSVKAGTAATAKQVTAYSKQCPTTKLVLAGYSQGAMVVHRNLATLADDPNVAATLLIADGDRLPVDTTIDMGTTAIPTAISTAISTATPLASATDTATASATDTSASTAPSVGKGVAQEHSFLASAPTSELPPQMGAKTISVCDVHDPVCDYDAATTELTPATLAIHTSYAPTTSGAHAWGTPLYQLVMNAAMAPTADPSRSS